MLSVTRRQVLSECLVIFEARARSVSKNLANREPMEGYEKQFDADQLRCRVIRELMQDIERGTQLVEEEARETADWQEVIRMHPEQALVMDL
ncbi:MAG: hypothetical protein IKT07_10650 [Oscillospiraceae bacterium]|nr:hypothetical protein [Oscillospiraceae bacterium]